MPTFADFTAKLSALSPNYKEWRSVFEQDEIPLTSPLPIQARLRDGTPALMYEIDYRLLSISELEHLQDVIMRGMQTNDPRKAIEYLRIRGGFPIRKEDVIVTMKPQLTAFADPQ